VRDEHVKDAAKDVTEDVTQDFADDVLGAAEDGLSSVSGGRIIITPVAYPQLPPTSTPPGVSSAAASSSSHEALFERLKTFDGVAVAVDS